jgi:ABC-2 type transport system permease protein
MGTRLLAIARKDIYTTFQDRQAILIMFAVPLALSLIIGLAFGAAGDVNIDAVEVGLVNQDQGTQLPGDQTLNLGQAFQSAFVPTGTPDAEYATIHDLTNGTLYENWDAARQKVEDGDLAAAIDVPADLSQIVFSTGQTGAVDVLYDSGQPIGASVVLAIVRRITNGINSVILAQRIGPDALTQLGGELNQDQAVIDRAIGELSAKAMSVAQAQPIQLEEVDLQGKTRTFDALQYFAPSMAILFMTFAMAAGGTSILVEQRRWTLQRILSTATPRWVFMGGKLAGTYVTGVIQMLILILSTTLVALVMGRENSVWGTNYAGIALLVLAVVLAGTSLGLLIAAFSKTEDQASTYSTVALFLLGMIGGSFFESAESLPGFLPRLTLNYWGIQGFVDLSQNDASLADITPNLLALVVMGVVLFAVSLWRFRQRLDLSR